MTRILADLRHWMRDRRSTPWTGFSAPTGPLHLIALPIGGLVEAGLAGLVGLGRDHRPDATPAQVAPQAGVAVALVTSHRVRAQPGPAPAGPLDRPGLHQLA
jgi:hypothetical protein